MEQLWQVENIDYDADLLAPVSFRFGRPADITELDLPSNIKTIFPDPADILNFELTIDPDEGEFACLSGVGWCRR